MSLMPRRQAAIGGNQTINTGVQAIRVETDCSLSPWDFAAHIEHLLIGERRLDTTQKRPDRAVGGCQSSSTWPNPPEMQYGIQDDSRHCRIADARLNLSVAAGLPSVDIRLGREQHYCLGLEIVYGRNYPISARGFVIQERRQRDPEVSRAEAYKPTKWMAPAQVGICWFTRPAVDQRG